MAFLWCLGLLVALVSSVSSQDPATTTSAGMTTTAKPAKGDNKQVKVHCARDYMEAWIVLAEMSNLDTSFLHLNDQSCKSTEVTADYVKFRTKLDGCGTTSNVSSDNEYIMYHNSITGNLKSKDNDTTITREHQAVMPFKCSYKRKMILSVVSFSPRKALVYTRTAAFGNFTFFMDMYRTDEYKETYSYPADIGVGQRMYLEVRVASNDTKIIVTPMHCRATAAKGYDEKPRYVFINESCGTDKTLKWTHTQSSAQRFSMLAFRFLPDFNSVYLHCEVAACRKGDKNSRCATGCEKNGGRRRRAVLETKNQISLQLTLGPIQRKNTQRKAAPVESNTGGIGLVTIVAITAGVLALVAFALVFIVVILIKRRPPVNGKHALLVVED